MQLQPEIVFRNVQYSEAVDTAIREQIHTLDDHHRNICGFTVTVESPERRGHEARRYAVNIDVSVHGGDVVVKNLARDDQAREDVFVAVQEAFDSLDGQLTRYEEKRRDDVKSRNGESKGYIERLFVSDGFGFIGTPDGRHIYFHHTAVLDGFAKLELGDLVQFVEELGDDGPQASTVLKVAPWKTLYTGARR